MVDIEEMLFLFLGMLIFVTAGDKLCFRRDSRQQDERLLIKISVWEISRPQDDSGCGSDASL